MDIFYQNCAKWIAGIFIGFALTANYYEFRKFVEAKGTHVKFSLKDAILPTTLPLLYMCLPLFAIYYKIVEIILWVKCGSRFGGLLKAADAAPNLDKANTVHALFVVKYKSNSVESFCDTVKETMRKSLLTEFRKCPKGFGIIRKSLGYLYVLKDEVPFEDCFKTLKKVYSPTGDITKADLSKLMSETTDIPLPKDSQSFWDVIVGTQPLKWKTNSQNDAIAYYPVIVRFNHSLADAAHFLRSFVGLFSDKDPQNLSKLQNELIKNTESRKSTYFLISKFLKNAGSKVKYYIQQCFAAIVAPAVIYGITLTRKADVIPKDTALQYRYNRCFRVEESPYYIPTLKRIKQKFPGSSFEDIVLAAYAASFSEYCKQNSKPIPEYILIAATVDPNGKKVMELSEKGPKIVCDNKALVKLCRMPVGIAAEGTYTSLVNTLEFIKKERLLSENTAEIMVVEFLNTVVLQLLPTPLIRLSMKLLGNYSHSFSSVADPAYFTVLEGCPVQDVILFNSTGPATGIVILNYTDRHQLGLTIDKALISNHSETQDLIDGIYRAIDLLDKTMVQEKI